MNFIANTPSDTLAAITEALDVGVERMVSTLRTGPVSDDGLQTFGRGWHDFYQERTRSAGAHATLEGYLLCKVPGIARRLAKYEFDPDCEVFESYLIPLFDPVPNDGWPHKKQDQRAEAEVTTTKVAKFIQCCFFSSNPKREELAGRYLKVLDSVVSKNRIKMGHSISLDAPASSFASAEALRARYVWTSDEAEKEEMLYNAHECISPQGDSLLDNPWRMNDIPWLRTMLPLVNAAYTTCIATLKSLSLEHPSRVIFTKILERVIRDEYFLMGDYSTETYSFRCRMADKARTDYVSFETTLALLPAIMCGVSHGICSTVYLNHIQHALIAWRGGRIGGYCWDLLQPSGVADQKNRFSYLVGILRTLALAEEVFFHHATTINNRLPMFVNPIRFNERGVVPDGKSAFLAIPFRREANLQGIEARLRLECSKAKFNLFRTDDLTDTTRDITQKIWRDICGCSFVIAVCDGKNSNVYYEIGLAHALGKPVFLCAAKQKDFTFDVRGVPHCVYNQTTELESSLSKFITHLNIAIMP